MTDRLFNRLAVHTNLRTGMCIVILAALIAVSGLIVSQGAPENPFALAPPEHAASVLAIAMLWGTTTAHLSHLLLRLTRWFIGGSIGVFFAYLTYSAMLELSLKAAEANVPLWWAVRDTYYGPNLFSIAGWAGATSGTLGSVLLGRYGRRRGFFVFSEIKSLIDSARSSEKLKRFYSGGATLIDQATKWLLLATLLFWLLHEREQRAVTQAWSLLAQAEGRAANLGRTDAMEYIARNDGMLGGVDVSRVDLRGLDIGMKIESGVTTDLIRSNGVNIIRADFSDANLERANLLGARASGATFDGAILSGADFTFAHLAGASFKGAWFGQVVVHQYTNFTGADLRGADLSDSPETAKYVADNRRVNPFSGDLFPVGGAIFLDADLRGAQIGSRAVGIYLFRESIGPTDRAFNSTFPLLTILAAKDWDSETEFPPFVEEYLQSNGLRDGPSNADAAARELLDVARQAMQQLLRQRAPGEMPRPKAYYEFLREREVMSEMLEMLKTIGESEDLQRMLQEE